METNQTKICTKCGRELPLSSFGKGNSKDGKRSWCKECTREYSRVYNKRKKSGTLIEPNPLLEGFTPQDLITELRARGYKGSLTFTETKIHNIKL